MRIERSGYGKFHGWSDVSNKEPHIEWDSDDDTITFTTQNNSDPSSNSRFNYRVRLSFKDITRIVQVLSEKALTESPKAVATGITDSSRHLLRLLLTSTGLLTDPKALLAAINSDKK
jgi:hypothetical protein